MALNYAENRKRYKLLRRNETIGQAKQMDEDNIRFNSIVAAILALITIFGLACLIIVGGCWERPAHAQTIPEQQIKQTDYIDNHKAIMAIIGEAEDQGYEGMLAIACAIRNRRTLKGVYGMRNPRVLKHKYSNATYELAIKAWADSANVDVTQGATGWGNKADLVKFSKRKWWSKCVITTHIGNHWFYKEKGT